MPSPPVDDERYGECATSLGRNLSAIEYIDERLYVRYDDGMNDRTIRLRPIDCCADVMEPAPLPSDEQERLLGVFKALADGTRLEIFRLIAAQTAPICACDIVSRFDVSQPTIAHHTKILREAGLITSTRSGVWAYYQVDPRGADLLASVAGQVLGAREAVAALA
jgi:ArsR family transcriptional regulator